MRRCCGSHSVSTKALSHVSTDIIRVSGLMDPESCPKNVELTKQVCLMEAIYLSIYLSIFLSVSLSICYAYVTATHLFHFSRFGIGHLNDLATSCNMDSTPSVTRARIFEQREPFAWHALPSPLGSTDAYLRFGLLATVTVSPSYSPSSPCFKTGALPVNPIQVHRHFRGWASLPKRPNRPSAQTTRVAPRSNPSAAASSA